MFLSSLVCKYYQSILFSGVIKWKEYSVYTEENVFRSKFDKHIRHDL